jgi:hypothetical protein
VDRRAALDNHRPPGCLLKEHAVGVIPEHTVHAVGDVIVVTADKNGGNDKKFAIPHMGNGINLNVPGVGIDIGRAAASRQKQKAQDKDGKQTSM